MPIIINDIEVIAPPPNPTGQGKVEPVNRPPKGPTPQDIYWVNRKLLTRQLRVHAR